MPDNVELDPGTGGAVVKTDDDGTAHWQYVKIAFGVDNTQTRVTSTSGLPSTLLAGSASIGTLGANSGIDIGDVDVTSITTGTGATNLGKAEDEAHTTGDVGVAFLGVRKDAYGTNVGTDGDYSSILTDENGQLKTVNQSLVSSANSTTTPLGISGVFTGTSEDVSNFAAINIVIFTDQASAANGLSLEWSTDGTNWDHVQTHSVLASTSFIIQAMGEGNYFRVVYTNGATGQSFFRMKIIYKTTPSLGEVQQLDEGVSDGSDAQLVRAILAGKTPGGAYQNVGITTGGNLKVAIEEADVSATGLAKAEDAVHSSGDTGVMALGVRNDVLASLVGADGDYSAFQTNDIGAVWTHHAPNDVNPNNSTTTPLGGSAVFTGTAVSLLDSAAVAITLDASHDSATDGMQFQLSTDGTNWDITHNFTYTAADGGREFQFGAGSQFFRVVFTNGATPQTHLRIETLLLHSGPITTIHRLVDNVNPDRSATIQKSVTIAQAAGSGDFVPVQATAAGNFKVSVEEFDTSLPSGTNNIGDVDVLTVPAPLSTTGGGTEAAALRVTMASDSTGVVSVDDNGGSLTVDNGGTFAVQAAGDIAHDAADSGNPIKTGSKSVLFNGTAPPNAAASEGDRVNHIADEYGRQFVEITHPNHWDVSVDYAVAQTNATVKAAPGAGLSLYITDILLSNGATAGNVTLLDGSGGTVKWEAYPAITGGAKDSRRSPIKLTANTLLAITSTTVTTHSLTISGFTAP